MSEAYQRQFQQLCAEMDSTAGAGGAATAPAPPPVTSPEAAGLKSQFDSILGKLQGGGPPSEVAMGGEVILRSAANFISDSPYKTNRSA